MDVMDDRNIRAELGSDGVLVATIDMPGRSMNVFSEELMNSLERLLDCSASRRDVLAVVIRSGKPNFIAGADLEMVRMFTQAARHDTPAQLQQLCGRLGRLFRRLETNGKPFVAAVNGLALGGGLELALACHARVVAEGALLGLPEVKLGLLPGAGGTQRLPRLIGWLPGLQIMLSGEPQPAARAQKLGFVDALVPLADLLDSARRRAAARANVKAVAPWDRPDWIAPTAPTDAARLAGELGIGEDLRRHYPAYDAIIACVSGGWPLTMDAACRWELDQFVNLIRNPVAGNMVRALFLERQRASKAVSAAPVRAARAAVKGPMADKIRTLLRTARVEVLEDDEPAVDAITIVSDAESARAAGAGAVAWLRDAPAAQALPAAFGVQSGVWVSDATAHGRTVEIAIDKHAAAEGFGIEIARWLKAAPLVTRGGSLLQPLADAQSASVGLSEEEKLLSVALAAARVRLSGVEFDLGIADAATVIAGFHPAYTGGPFNYLVERGAAAVAAQAAIAAERHGPAFAVSGELAALLSELPHGSPRE